MRRVVAFCLGCAAIVAATALGPSAQTIALGRSADSLKFAVLGDFGTGERAQNDLADQMWSARGAFPFDLVLALRYTVDMPSHVAPGRKSLGPTAIDVSNVAAEP